MGTPVPNEDPNRLTTEQQVQRSAALVTNGGRPGLPPGMLATIARAQSTQNGQPVQAPVTILTPTRATVLPPDLTPEERAALAADGASFGPGGDVLPAIPPGFGPVVASPSPPPPPARSTVQEAVVAFGRGGKLRVGRVEAGVQQGVWTFPEETLGELVPMLNAFGIHVVDLASADDTGNALAAAVE